MTSVSHIPSHLDLVLRLLSLKANNNLKMNILKPEAKNNLGLNPNNVLWLQVGVCLCLVTKFPSGSGALKHRAWTKSLSILFFYSF